MGAELLPCPWCGSSKAEIRENGRMWTGQRMSDPVSVSVMHWCEPAPGQPSRMIERIGRDGASAIAAWNTRAAQPDAEPRAWLHVGTEQAFTDEPPPRLKEQCDPLYTHAHPPQWQPIETAPKNGTYVQVFPPTWKGVSSCAVWDSNESAKKPRPFWRRTDDHGQVTTSREKSPTHWMPLPAAPDGGEKGAA